MSRLDPRAQLALFAAVLAATLFGGVAGLIAGAAIAGFGTIRLRAARPILRALAAVAPLAAAVAALDALAGHPAEGVTAAARLITLTLIATAFARAVDSRSITEGLRALRVPYPVVFVLVTGARFVPIAAADLGELADAARLRGVTVSGPAWRRLAEWRILLVPLLVLAIRRGLQLGEAMEARGFSTGAGRASLVQLRWRARDTVSVALGAAALVLVLVVGSELR